MPPRTRLGRTARGLPRFYMDVGWWQHPAFARLPADSLFLFQAIVSYSTQHATDGLCPGDPEDLAAVLGVRASVVRKALRPLIDRGRLVERGDDLAVPGWADHNPTSDEIEQHSTERAAAGSYGNHKRWHASRGDWRPAECLHCAREAPPPDRNSDRNSDPPSDGDSDSVAIANGSLGMGWDGMGVTTSSTTGTSDATSKSGDDLEAWVERGSVVWATRLAAQVPAHVGLTTEQARTELLALAAEHPDLDDDALLADLAARHPA